MTQIAWSDGRSSVACTDGTRGTKCHDDPDRWQWDSALTSETAPSDGNTGFYVQGTLVAVEGDKMAQHPDGSPCTSSPVMHEPTTSLHAANFYVAGKRVMRVGAKFNNGTTFDHEITTGCDTFIVGGPSA